MKVGEGYTLRKAVEFASKAAAVTVMRMGAQKTIPKVEEVEAFIV